MNKMLLVAAALAVMATPVFAQSQGSKGQQQAPQTTTGQGQQAAQPKAAPAQRSANDVFCGGVYLGSDPDVNVRQQMIRDYKHECE